MRKIGLSIAAAAAVLTSFVAPANAGCKSVTKIFESGSRTVTQKGLRQFRFRSERFAGRQGLRFPRERFAERQRRRFPGERFAEQQTGYHLAPTGPGPANLCPTGLCGAGALTPCVAALAWKAHGRSPSAPHERARCCCGPSSPDCLTGAPHSRARTGRSCASRRSTACCSV